MTNINRRDFLKITAVLGTGLAAGTLLTDSVARPQFSVKETRSMMGTTVHFTVLSNDQPAAEAAIKAAFNEMERLIAVFDHRNASSALAKLNASGQCEDCPPELVAIFEKAQAISQLCGGAFDITVKPIIDARKLDISSGAKYLDLVDYRAVSLAGRSITFGRPGMQASLDAIAKGAVVDGGVAALKGAGCSGVLVEAGGDLMVGGRPFDKEAWRIGVTHPRAETGSEYLAAFSFSNGAAATSGDYYQALTPDRSQNHIVDPRTGESPSELASATVLASDAATADALATTIMVLGSKAGLQLANSLNGVEAMVVSKDLVVTKTAGFPDLV